MCTFGVLWVIVCMPRRPGKASKTEKTPRESTKSEMFGGRVKKERNFGRSGGGGPVEGEGPAQSGPNQHPHHHTNHNNKHHTNHNNKQIIQKWIGYWLKSALTPAESGSGGKWSRRVQTNNNHNNRNHNNTNTARNGPRGVGAPKGGAPEAWGPRRVGSRRVGPLSPGLGFGSVGFRLFGFRKFGQNTLKH